MEDTLGKKYVVEQMDGYYYFNIPNKPTSFHRENGLSN